MEETFRIAAVWLSLAVVATILANHLRISMALVEICVGIVAGAVSAHFFGSGALGSSMEWLRFLAAVGAVLLTFLAGAELEPTVFRTKWKEVTAIGLVGFLAPFLGCAALVHYVLKWNAGASWLAGIALSTTSVAVVYAVMLETGLNRTEFGKGVLGACFINDLGTVIALGLIFAPFTYKTLIFIVVIAIVISALPFLTSWITRRYAYGTAAIRAKWVLLILLSLGWLALWSGSEAVLPAYIAGMVLAGFAGQDHLWIRRMRTMTIGFLTPFYFIRAGSLVSLPALCSAPIILLVLLAGKASSKILGLYPVVGCFRKRPKERWYYTLMMSTGLTFGTISALFGLSHGIITQGQYSFLVAVVIGSAVIPTIIANAAFLPRNLLEKKDETEMLGLGIPVEAHDSKNEDGLADE
ncbi:MAG: glutathione-regulated potassium-efflux system protein KefB [Syntrophorhabdus sp. PtaU1.Bin058]|nr:MAG: glutathione-regulated potassium-efflux system protein KefB [Syntrophorhabdus sp. PtaU1.Bin058]